MIGTKLLRNKSVREFCRIVLGVVFIYAGIGKILRPAEFADAVAAFKLLPLCAVNVFAITLPWIEIAAGLAVLSRTWQQCGGLLMMGLNAVFLIAAASAMIRGLDIDCGCFTLSHAHSKVGWELLVRDVGLLLLCAPLIWAGKGEDSRECKSPAQTA